MSYHDNSGCGCFGILAAIFVSYWIWHGLKFLFVHFTLGTCCLVGIIVLAVLLFVKKEWKKWLIASMVTIAMVPVAYHSYQWRVATVRANLQEREFDLLMQQYADDEEKIRQIDCVQLDITVQNQTSSYNHVGHEWIKKNYVNQERIKAKGSIRYHYGDELFIRNEIEEWDRSADYGNSSLQRSFSKEELAKGIDIELHTYVYEDRGRYAGYGCHWVTTYHFSVKDPDKRDLSIIDVPQDSIRKYFWQWGEFKQQ